KDQSTRLTGGERLGNLSRVPPGSISKPRAKIRGEPNLTKPPRVGPRGNLDETRPISLIEPQSLSNRQKSIDRLLAAGPMRKPLAPEDHNRPGTLEDPCELIDIAARRGGRTRGSERRRQGDEEGFRFAWGVADGGCCVAVECRRVRGCYC